MLEFNLSQFENSTDLIGAFHQVRDKVLAGATPVVFWDEFDSKKFDWLQYLSRANAERSLSGRTADTHFVGRVGVFIFAGGTSHAFKVFDGRKDEKHFQLKEGTDFISRLSGYLDIAGPNQREATPGRKPLPDREFPVRRAMVIRIALGLDDRPLQIERGLLTALLGVGRYRNGARSPGQSWCPTSRDRGGMPLRRAYLLALTEILALYVENVDQFHQLTRKYAEFYAQADLLARAIHEDWLKGLSAKEKSEKPTAMPWDELAPDIKDSNSAAALRMPEILEGWPASHWRKQTKEQAPRRK